jgi:hypothetical protein
MGPTGAGGRGADIAEPEYGDHHNVTFAEAKTRLMQGFPRPGMDVADTRDLVEIYIAIGRYTVDRWGAEEEALKHPPPFSDVDLEEVRDSCTQKHFTTIWGEALAGLQQYVAQRNTVVPAAELEKAVARVQAAVIDACRTPKKEPLWKWTLIEMGKGPIALLGVLLVAAVVTQAIKLIWPGYVAEAWHSLRLMLGGA